MINTVNIKQQQLTNTYFKVGSGEEKILVMGSCRVCPYLNYLNEWNIQNGNRFTIYSIDPFNWHWDIEDNRVDYTEALLKLETHEGLLTMLKSVDIFCHEFYKNAEMFSCDRSFIKNIYCYGIKPKIDICIPSWNDVFIYFGDIVSMDVDIRKKATQDFNVLGKLSGQTFNEMCAISNAAIHKFKKVCALSDIPEMWQYFLENFREVRFAHNSNHVSKYFTLAVFNIIMRQFLGIELSEKFKDEISRVDMFDNSFTPLTNYDVACHNYQWNEPIKDLKDKL